MLLEKRGFGGLGLNGADTGAGKVLLLALKGGVDLAEAAAVVAVEGAFGPVHGHRGAVGVGVGGSGRWAVISIVSGGGRRNMAMGRAIEFFLFFFCRA